MAQYVMALDEGKTRNRFILFNKKERLSVRRRRSLLNIFQNRAGWSMMQMKSGPIS